MKNKTLFSLPIIAILVVFAIFATACSKDKDDKPEYLWEIAQDFVGFLQSHAWHISIYAKEDAEDSSRLKLEVYAANYAEHIPFSDDFYMSVNGNVRAVIGMYDESFQELDFEGFSIAKGEKVKIVFKHNNELIIAKTLAVPEFATFTEVPGNPDFDQDLSFNWELKKNSDFQSILVWATAGNVHYRTFMLPSSARSFTLPTDTIRPAGNASSWGMHNLQYNLVEQGNCVFFTCTKVLQDGEFSKNN